MSVSRRLFLQNGILTAVACTASPLFALGEKRPTDSDRQREPLHKSPSNQSENWKDHASALDGISRAAFAAVIGSSFKVFPAASNQAPVYVRLLAVEDLPRIETVNAGSFAVAPKKSSSPTPTTTGFVLLFGSSAHLAQNTYLFEHDSLGRFALFTVPDARGQEVYSGVINRLDGRQIIAVPFHQGEGGSEQPHKHATTPAGAIMVSPATSSDNENLSRGLSQNRGVQRGAVRD